MDDEVAQLVALVRRKGYRNLIFDLDETLTQLDVPWDEWIDQVVGALPPAAAKKLTALLAIDGAPWGMVVNEQIMQDQAFYDQFIKICQDFEAKYLAHTPYDALVKALPELKTNGAQLFLWTSNTRQTAERALTELGVLPLFSKLATREDAKLGKPDAAAWRSFGLADNELSTCLMIGDSQSDELAADAVGIDFYKITFFK